jgi:hypothetical protein
MRSRPMGRSPLRNVVKGMPLSSPSTFAEIVAARKEWIETVLRPWCVQALHRDLRIAEEAWPDIAGRADPEKTLWYWAWSRFANLVNADLLAIDEARAIRVTLRDGRVLTGFPDARKSRQGKLVLLGRDPDVPHRAVEHGPFEIDLIASIDRAE